MQALTNIFTGLATGQPGKAGWAVDATWRELVLYGLATLLILSACVAGLVGLGIYLVPQYGAVGATLIVAGVALVLALALIVMALLIERKAKRIRKRDEQAMVTNAMLTLAPHVLQTRSPLSLLLAGGLGYLAADALGGKDEAPARSRPEPAGRHPNR